MDENAIFKTLAVEKIKKRPGSVLTGYKFTFDKEKTIQYVENKYAKHPKSNRPKYSKMMPFGEKKRRHYRRIKPRPTARIAKLLLSSNAEKITE